MALLSAVLAALLLGGHPETVLQACGLVALALLACAWERRRAGAPVRGLLARGVGAMALAGLLVAPSLLLQARYLPQTERASVVEWFLPPPRLAELAAALRDPQALREWGRRVEVATVSVVAAHAYGDHERYWGVINYVEEGGGCVGAAVAVLALAAAARRRAKLPLERLMIGLAAVCLLVVAQPPYADRFLGQLPLLGPSAVHHSHRLVLLVGFAAAYVAACEVERWHRGAGSRRALAIAAAVVVAGVLWAYLGHPAPGTSGLDAGQGRWLAIQLTAAAAVSALLLPRGAPSTARARLAAPWALAALVAAELALLHGEALAPGPARLFYPLTPPLRFLRDHLGGARLVGMGEALPANFSQVYGLGDARIDDPARPRVYIEAIAPLRPSPVTLENLSQLSGAASRLYDLLGVRYVITEPGRELGLPVVFRHRSGWIHEHPRPLPRLFLPPTATLNRGGDWAAWLRRPRDFAARALVSEPPPGTDAPRWRARRARSLAFGAARREPARWSMRLEAPERRLLASSIYHDGGWRLQLDGRPHPTVLANGPFVGAWVPAGAHRLELLYRPPGLALGCLVAALALGAGVARLLPPPRPLALGAPRSAPA